MWCNSVMQWLLRSRLHGLISKSVLLITVTGCKSGKLYSTPVNYVRHGSAPWVTSQRDRTWWRNLKDGAPVRALIAGKELIGRGETIVDEKSVAQDLVTFLGIAPQYAKYFRVSLNPSGQPSAEDCARAARERVMVRIELDEKIDR